MAAELDKSAVDLAPLIEGFGIDAVELDMLKRGDMLSSIGAKVFSALETLSFQSLRSQAGVSEADCEATLNDALKFVQPKLQAIKTEKGVIGVFCQAWRMAWKSRLSAPIKENGNG